MTTSWSDDAMPVAPSRLGGVIRSRAVQADIESEGNRSTLSRASFWIIVVTILAALDLWDDLHDDKAAWILALHVVFSIPALGVACTFGFQVVRLGRRVRELTDRLQLPGPDRDAWRSQSAGAVPAFAAALQRQLAAWGLDDVERGVAMLLLNGLSARQIADVRATEVAVVEQQIASVYRKAGLSGRADLHAFFFSDLVR